MADRARPDKAATEPRPTQSSPDREPEERKFSVDELIEAPRLCGARSGHEVAGALHGQSRKTFTADQASKLVTKFRAHRDETEGRHPGDDEEEQAA